MALSMELSRSRLVAERWWLNAHPIYLPRSVTKHAAHRRTTESGMDTRAMRNSDRVNRAMTIAAQGQLPVPSQRTGIAPEVRQLVWQRDQGRCVHCGATSELQLDHQIPVSMGGSNTEANLQLLCGPCNRRKGAAVV
jgi:5-methylcytosine-specific restriction endonuclease McrA